MTWRSLLGLGSALRRFLDGVEASRLPGLRTSKILGALTVACLIFVLVVVRWLCA